MIHDRYESGDLQRERDEEEKKKEQEKKNEWIIRSVGNDRSPPSFMVGDLYELRRYS